MLARWTEFVAAWPLFAEPALTAACAGACLGGLSVFVVLAQMIFVSAALGQVASCGVATGFALRPTLASLAGPVAARWSGAGGAALATTLAAIVLAAQARLRPRGLEALLGLLFALGAGGTLVAANYATAELHDIQSLLFGSAVAVAPGTLPKMAAACALVLAGVGSALPALGEAFVDPVGARVRGLPLFWLQAGLLVAAAGSIAYATATLGALPTFALSTAPGLASLAQARSLPRAFVAACAGGAACGFAGYVLAFACAWPVGATQALVAGGLAGAAHLGASLRAMRKAGV